jgi:hypothetical protein
MLPHQQLKNTSYKTLHDGLTTNSNMNNITNHKEDSLQIPISYSHLCLYLHDQLECADHQLCLHSCTVHQTIILSNPLSLISYTFLSLNNRVHKHSIKIQLKTRRVSLASYNKQQTQQFEDVLSIFVIILASERTCMHLPFHIFEITGIVTFNTNINVKDCFN